MSLVNGTSGLWNLEAVNPAVICLLQENRTMEDPQLDLWNLVAS